MLVLRFVVVLVDTFCCYLLDLGILLFNLVSYEITCSGIERLWCLHLIWVVSYGFVGGTCVCLLLNYFC